MKASARFLALGAFAAIASFGALSANADTMDGSDYHPLQMNSPSNADVNAGAWAASHPTGTESVGQSTSAPMVNSSMSRADVYAGAVAAAHPSGTESIGQSTGMAGIMGGVPH